MIKKLEKLLKLLNNLDFAEINGVYYADWVEMSGAPHRHEGKNLEEIIDYIFDLYFDMRNEGWTEVQYKHKIKEKYGSVEKMTLSEIRKKLKDSNNGVFEKITVIRRDGNIVCREDVGSPRNSNLKIEMFDGFVKRTLGEYDTTATIFSGRKGIYTNYWVEVVLNKNL